MSWTTYLRRPQSIMFLSLLTLCLLLVTAHRGFLAVGVSLAVMNITIKVPAKDVPAAAAALQKALSEAPADAAPPGPLVLAKYVVLPKYIAPLVDELRATFVWRQELRAYAQSTLRGIASVAADALGEPAESVQFVGVHVRRTDYPAWMRKKLHSERVAEVPYYETAVTRLRLDLDAAAGAAGAAAGGSGGAGPLALVLVSDDMHWVRTQLMPALRALEQRVGRVMAFAAGGGTDLRDLALLAACNHTVMAYGTYAMTAALLAGGRVVAFRLTSSYPSTQFAALDPRWVVLD